MWSHAAVSQPDEMQRPLLLVLLVLLVLVWSLADGAIMSKCDLRDELAKTIGNLTVMSSQRELTGDNLVAEFVCHAQLESHFNTSLVKDSATKIDKDHLNLRRRRTAKELSHNPKASADCVRCGRAAAEATGTGTFYGIFQLSSRLVCSDGTSPSPTICGLACSELVDDDIRDDIRCLMTIFTISGNSGLEAADMEELNKMIRFILRPRCCVVQPSAYFAKCPRP